MKTVQVDILGHVQGVFFRASTQSEAQKRGINGYVKNRHDGAVEALFQGEASQVSHLIKWCHTGPPSARVSAVHVSEKPNDVSYSDFSIQ